MQQEPQATQLLMSLKQELCQLSVCMQTGLQAAQQVSVIHPCRAITALTVYMVVIAA